MKGWLSIFSLSRLCVVGGRARVVCLASRTLLDASGSELTIVATDLQLLDSTFDFSDCGGTKQESTD